MKKMKNLEVHPRTQEVAPYYNRASIVLNLSDKKQFVETFGMTALEAMNCGLPTVVPTVGGIADMVSEGQTGFHIDVMDMEKIKQNIQRMLTDETMYQSLASNALKEAKKYDADAMVGRIMELL